MAEKKERTPTALGARILEAAIEVGLDEIRLNEAAALPPGAVTRLLYHEVKKLKLEHVERVALVIGCEPMWLRTGEGERRTKPIPPGIVSARSLGASEEAILFVLQRDGSIQRERDEATWLATFLEESKDRRTKPSDDEAPPSAEPSSIRIRE